MYALGSTRALVHRFMFMVSSCNKKFQQIKESKYEQKYQQTLIVPYEVNKNRVEKMT